jgi:hypothetical protein
MCRGAAPLRRCLIVVVFVARGPYRIKRRVGVHSRIDRLVQLDGRTREGLAAEKFRKELEQSFGGEAALSTEQRILVDRATWLQVRIWLMDSDKRSTPLSARDSAYYLSWSNALTRCIGRLAKLAKANPTPKRTMLADITARIRAESVAVQPAPKPKVLKAVPLRSSATAGEAA